MRPWPTPWSIRLAAAVALAVDPTAAWAAPPDEMLFERAFTYAFPLQEMALLRARLTAAAQGASAPGGGSPAAARPAGAAAPPAGAPTVGWRHVRTLSGPNDRAVTTPNNDTLYSTAWLDLSRRPVRITVPELQGRYYSIALLDPFTNNFEMIGRRTVGTRPATFLLVGPAWTGTLPENERVVVAPSNEVLALLRILVDGPGDLPSVHALQNAFRLEPVGEVSPDPVAAPIPTAPTPTAPSAALPTVPPDPPARFVTLVNQMLARNPAPAHERALLREFASVGICGADCTWEALPEPVRQSWRRLWPQLNARLREASAVSPSATASSWETWRAQTGNFGTHYGYRASVALNGLLALEPVEAMYLSARVDGRGEPLTGERRYRLRIPAGGLPVDAFWSLSMYEVDATGRLFFVDNPLARYAIGDRTPNLAHNPDGSLDLWIQADAPVDAVQRANWLPAPKGAFRLFLRAYQPRSELLDLRVTLPALERLPADRWPGRPN